MSSFRKIDLTDPRIVAIEVTPMWSGDLDSAHVDAVLLEHGVPKDKLPRMPSRATAMRRAFDHCAPRGAKIDMLPKGLGVTMSIKDINKLDLQELAEKAGTEVRQAASYHATLSAKIFVQNINGTEIEQLQFTPEDHPMVPLLREVYHTKREQYKASEDLSVWFSQTIIPTVGGVGKRSRGGVYYVPAARQELLVNCAEALDSMSESQVLVREVAGTSIPVHRLMHGGKICMEPRYADDSAAMEIMVDGVIRETDSVLDQLTDVLNASATGEKALGLRALKSKREHLLQLEQEIVTWESAASMSLDLLRDRLEEARSALGMAELVAEANAAQL